MYRKFIMSVSTFYFCYFFFFFSSRRRHTRYWRDWSSDVCSSDLDTLRGNRQTRPTETRTHIRTLPPQIRKRPSREMVRRRKIQEKSSRDTAWTGPGKEDERQG